MVTGSADIELGKVVVVKLDDNDYDSPTTTGLIPRSIR